nr:RNA-directed DNA polymerase, eukaryota [Tanacetum cinerariifolium]
KIQANIARFRRSPLNNNNVKSKHSKARESGGAYDIRTKGVSNSSLFASVVAKNPNTSAVEVENVPAIVLEDDCLKTNDLSCSLMGRVKEFAALTNLKSALRNEGFVDIKIQFLGELWVLLDFKSSKIKDSFQGNVGAKSWFTKIIQASEPELVEELDGEEEEEEELSDKASMDGELKEQDDENNAGYSNLEAVPETIFNNPSDSKTNVSEDPFDLYKLLQKNGGILCVWDSNLFVNESHTISNFFVINRGKWLKSSIDLIIMAVYGPHDPRDKRMVWEYLSYVINQWNGNVVIMGDFNEVRYKSDRFGFVFNVQGAEEFNAFIADVGLEEVPLGGSSFTWCHKSATKMSKLDRFFVSNSILNLCPHFSAITLERFLSDHRPILLREINFDYGPTPFRFFHHWMELDGFSNFVSDVWKSAPGSKTEKGNSDSVRFKEELRVLDEKIDKKDGSNELVQRRTDLIKDINHLDQIRSMDLAQKSKVKWAIEGDENSRFFHGILNKKT